MNILIMGLDWLGDVLFSTALIHALRQQHPDATLIYSTTTQVAPALQYNRDLNEVLTFDEAPLLLNLKETMRFYRALKSRHFDRVYLLHRSKTRGFLCRLAGIPERIGFSSHSAKYHLTKIVPEPQQSAENPLHRANRYLAIAPEAVQGQQRLHMRVAQVNRDEVKHLFQEAGWQDDMPYLVIHPGGNWDLKRWPESYFVEMILSLARFKTRMVLCGTAKESALVERIVKTVAKPRQVISLCGQTSLLGLGALLEGCDLMISNDSGPLHLASALNKPVLGLFGPTLPEVTGPFGGQAGEGLRGDVGCEVPCYFSECHDQACMKALLPTEVVNAVKKILYEDHKT